MLSHDLQSMLDWLDGASNGAFEVTPGGIAEFRVALGKAVSDAKALEGTSIPPRMRLEPGVSDDNVVHLRPQENGGGNAL